MNPNLAQFIGPNQTTALAEMGEESRVEIVAGLLETIENMPETYGQDGKGDQSIAYLHYFNSGMDWYITERDSDPDGDGQTQAYGWADLGQGVEIGYISIAELIRFNVELDFYFDPKTLAEIKGW